MYIIINNVHVHNYVGIDLNTVHVHNYVGIDLCTCTCTLCVGDKQLLLFKYLVTSYYLLVQVITNIFYGT